MKRFTNDIVDIKRGDTDINKVYRGENLVWESVSISIPMSGLLLYLDAGDVASYPGTGTTWFDLSGNNHDAVLENGADFDNLFAINFDGIDDRVSITHNSVARIGASTPGHTIITWVNNTETNECDIFSTGEGGGIGDTADVLFMIFENKLRGHVWNNDASPEFYDAPDDFGSNNWKMAAQVVNWDISVMTLDLWENDTKVVSEPLFGDVGVSSRTNAYLGTRPFSAFFAGKMSIVLVYDRPLSDVEIQSIYDLTKDRFITQD